jgi:hypothetical protein
MSETDNTDKTIEMITKLNKLNTQTKAIYDTLQQIVTKLDSKDAKTQGEVKEEVSICLEKKGVGRPLGSYNDKRLQYF